MTDRVWSGHCRGFQRGGLQVDTLKLRASRQTIQQPSWVDSICSAVLVSQCYLCVHIGTNIQRWWHHCLFFPFHTKADQGQISCNAVILYYPLIIRCNIKCVTLENRSWKIQRNIKQPFQRQFLEDRYLGRNSERLKVSMLLLAQGGKQHVLQFKWSGPTRDPSVHWAPPSL